LDWVCSQCQKKKETEFHPYTHKLLRLRKLQLAGYPLGPNDLTVEEWLDLGWINDWFGRNTEQRQPQCPLMRKRRK